MGQGLSKRPPVCAETGQDVFSLLRLIDRVHRYCAMITRLDLECPSTLARISHSLRIAPALDHRNTRHYIGPRRSRYSDSHIDRIVAMVFDEELRVLLFFLRECRGRVLL